MSLLDIVLYKALVLHYTLYAVQRASCKYDKKANANAKVRYTHNSLNHPSLAFFAVTLYIIYTSLKSTKSQCATMLTMWVYLHSFSRCCLPNMRSSAKFRENL